MITRSIRALFLALVCLFSIPAFSAPLDINQASAEQLSQTMKGVGPAKAAAIVAYREQNGPFSSVEQLVAVKGIGSATVDKNRDLITVAPATTATDAAQQ